MTKLVIVSDTHVPKRARTLPQQVWDAIDAADVVFHAGDWVDLAIVDEFESRAARLIAVTGNNDEELGGRLPKVAHATIDGIRFGVIHDSGAAEGRSARMDAAFPDTDVLIFGHSHIPWDAVTPRGMRLLNPGSPTDRRNQPAGTFLTASTDAGQLVNLRLVPITPA